MPLLYLTSPLLEQHHFKHAFSLRTGGVSEGPFASLNVAKNVGDVEERVQANLERLCSAVGVALTSLHQCDQVHGRNVHVVTPSLYPFESEVAQADALVATGAGQVVGVRTADCVPILLADTVSGTVAAVHAGWKGCVADVVSEAVAAVLSMTGGDASTLIAAIGPHIGQDAFEVSADVARTFEELAGTLSAHGFICRTEQRCTVSLLAVVKHQLEHAGVPRIDVVAGCTYAEPKRFFSHRRDQGKTGRHLNLIAAR